MIGFCVWLTGLSGAGKSTLASALQQQLETLGVQATVFDGDALRRDVSRDLGYTRADRAANVLRVAALAADVVNASGVAICALMSPAADARDKARILIGPERFMLVHVDPPLSTCEARDTKGLYARARRGELHHVIGIDEPYETPAAPDLRLDTSHSDPAADVRAIISVLIRRALLDATPDLQDRLS